MRWLRPGYESVALSLTLVGLVLVACAGPSGDAGLARAVAPQQALTDEPRLYLTINVELTDDGFTPSSVFIPAGRPVQLVVRNRASAEHHYRVLGLVPQDLLWLAQDLPTPSAASTGTDEHDDHHAEISFVPFRFASAAGIRPTGTEVHAYAQGGEVDAVLFTATKAGTFSVRCPLHREVIGKLTVF